VAPPFVQPNPVVVVPTFRHEPATWRFVRRLYVATQSQPGTFLIVTRTTRNGRAESARTCFFAVGQVTPLA
jgi:hypothetical protein